MEAPYAYDRYQRQLILKGFGVEAQDKLRRGRVLVIGAGGLGCPIIQYLVAAGVGHIGVADPDKVSVSNLHRQILFGADDIGAWKADVVRQKMQRLDPDAEIIIWKEQWMHPHCLEFFPQYDVVVDATDNFASRYMINDAAVLTGKPLVFGAVSQYEGQVAVFNCPIAEGGRSVHYRDLFPDPPQDGEVLNCSEGGVLGVLPGIIGCLQAAEVIKLLTGIGSPLANQLLMLLACLLILLASVSGLVMWWKRRPQGHFGVPPLRHDLPLWKGGVAIMFGLGLLFPLVGASLLLMLVLDWLDQRLTRRGAEAVAG